MSARIDPDAGDDIRISRTSGPTTRTTVPVRPVRAATTTTTPTTTPTTSATASHLPPRPVERRRRKAPLAWLPLAALAALATLLLLSLLLINAVDDDGPDGAAGDSLGQSSISDGSGVNGQDGSGSGGAAPAPAPAPAPATAPSLRVGEQDLLRLAGGGLGGVVGQPVTGTGRVESVVSDEGFWVGTSATDRVFVFLTPAARGTAGESGYQVKAGETVTLEGRVIALSEQPDVAAGVEADEGRGQLEQEAAFVRVRRVALAE